MNFSNLNKAIENKYKNNLNESLEETKKVSKFINKLNESQILSERKWQLTIPGSYRKEIFDAGEEEDFEGVRIALVDICDFVLSHISEIDSSDDKEYVQDEYENFKDELEYSDIEDEDEANYWLDELYDLLDNTDIFLGINESLNESQCYPGFCDGDYFFTREEINEFADEIALSLSGWANEEFYVSDVYMDSPKKIHVELTNGDIWIYGDAIIDFRKIKYPSDIKKYEDVILKQLKDSLNEYDYFNESLNEEYEKVDISDYKYVGNVDGFLTYRKIITDENGKMRGIWAAQDQDEKEPPFRITYNQALGYEPIKDTHGIKRLSRDLGRLLLPQNESLKESNEDDVLTLYHGTNKELSNIDFLSSKELGLHAGTLEQAQNKGRIIYQIDVDKNTPTLNLHDDLTSGYFSSPKFLILLKNNNIIGDMDFENLYQTLRLYSGEDGENKYKGYSEAYRNFLLNKGFKLIKYPNKAEGNGYSYIILDDSIIKSIKNIDEKSESSESLNEEYAYRSMDALHELDREIEDYLNQNNFHGFIDLYDINPNDEPVPSITYHIDGDWKHEHLRFKYLVKEFLNSKDIVHMITEREYPSDSDSYEADYTIHLMKHEDDIDESIDVESAGIRMLPLQAAIKAKNKFNQEAKKYPYWVIETEKWYDPEGLNIENDKFNIKFAGDYNECADWLSKLINKAKADTDSCVIEEEGKDFVKIYYPHAIAKAMFSIKKNDNIQNESLEETVPDGDYFEPGIENANDDLDSTIDNYNGEKPPFNESLNEPLPKEIKKDIDRIVKTHGVKNIPKWQIQDIAQNNPEYSKEIWNYVSDLEYPDDEELEEDIDFSSPIGTSFDYLHEKEAMDYQLIEPLINFFDGLENNYKCNITWNFGRRLSDDKMTAGVDVYFFNEEINDEVLNKISQHLVDYGFELDSSLGYDRNPWKKHFTGKGYHTQIIEIEDVDECLTEDKEASVEFTRGNIISVLRNKLSYEPDIASKNHSKLGDYTLTFDKRNNFAEVYPIKKSDAEFDEIVNVLKVFGKKLLPSSQKTCITIYGDEPLTEDTIKQNNKWVNKGKEGTHGTFKTKKEADAQRRAMFANGFNESLRSKRKLKESYHWSREWIPYEDEFYKYFKVDDDVFGTVSKYINDEEDATEEDVNELREKLVGKHFHVTDIYLEDEESPHEIAIVIPQEYWDDEDPVSNLSQFMKTLGYERDGDIDETFYYKKIKEDDMWKYEVIIKNPTLGELTDTFDSFEQAESFIKSKLQEYYTQEFKDFLNYKGYDMSEPVVLDVVEKAANLYMNLDYTFKSYPIKDWYDTFIEREPEFEKFIVR